MKLMGNHLFPLSFSDKRLAIVKHCISCVDMSQSLKSPEIKASMKKIAYPIHSGPFRSSSIANVSA